MRGPSALIWSRPVDSYPIALNVSAFLRFSPPYVLFSGWVGDQDPDFSGLRDALVNIYESAWQNYTNFASDTGGYRSGSRTSELFLRWAQVNAFLPLLENGGDDDHTPWGFDERGGTGTFVLDAYRRLVAAHYELQPYLLSTGAAAWEARVSSITPAAPPPVTFPFILQPDYVSDWCWLLGANIFVSPIVTSGGSANGTLPPATQGWAHFWDASSPALPGGSRFSLQPALNESAVFVRVGALLPLHVSTPLGLVREGGASFASALTLFAHGTPADGEAASEAEVRVGGGCLDAGADARCRTHGGARASLQRRGRELLLNVSALEGDDAQDVILYLRAAPRVERAFLRRAEAVAGLNEPDDAAAGWAELPRREPEAVRGPHGNSDAALPWRGHAASGAAAAAAAADRVGSWSQAGVAGEEDEGAAAALIVRCGSGAPGVLLRLELEQGA